ncbi:MAG: helix-turn-helix transcriptional regulator [bacterium]
MSYIKRQLGLRIFELRKQMNMSQSKLAELTDFSDNFIGLIERGQRAPSLEGLEKIASALKVEIKELFSFSGAAEKNIKEEQLISKISAFLRKRDIEEIKMIYDVVRRIFER